VAVTNPAPFSPEEVTVLRGMVETLLALDDITGGWTAKSDVRQSGFSLHVKFDRKSSVDEVLRAVQVFEQTPIKFCQVASRVLDQLDAAEKAV
jgi:hypothetical protein